MIHVITDKNKLNLKEKYYYIECDKHFSDDLEQSLKSALNCKVIDDVVIIFSAKKKYKELEDRLNKVFYCKGYSDFENIINYLTFNGVYDDKIIKDVLGSLTYEERKLLSHFEKANKHDFATLLCLYMQNKGYSEIMTNYVRGSLLKNRFNEIYNEVENSYKTKLENFKKLCLSNGGTCINE